MGIGPNNYITFGDLKNTIQNLVPELGMDTIGTMVANKHRKLVRDWQWSFLKGDKNIALVGPYNTGTVSISQGDTALEGVATAWTADMIGRFVRIGTVPYSFYQVQGVTDATHLELTQPYGGSSMSGQAYTMFQHIYSFGTDVREIISLTYDVPMYEKSVEFFDRCDPYRSQSGTPRYFADKGVASNGSKLVEIFPVSSDAYTLKCSYWKGYPDLKDDGDVIMLRDDLLQEAALVDLYRVAANINSMYKANVAEAAVIFKQLWIDAIEEDNRKTSAESGIRDYADDEVYGSDWEKNHFTGDII